MAAEVERHSVTEAYVDELRARVAKLSERETATEAYIQDLEEKIKGFSSTSLTTSDSLSSLQKELARYKDSEQTNASYIAGLEARLGKSEETVLQLRRAVEEAENVAHTREEQVKDLEKKLDLMKGDEEGWRSDLEVRENKVRELEAQLREWEARKEDAIRDRSRLGDLIVGVEDAKRDLDSSTKGSSPVEESLSVVNGQTTHDAQLEDKYKELEETHTATLADLSTVTDKYRDALREISDLAVQLQEAKLNQHSHSNTNSVSDHGEMNSNAPITRRRKPSSSHSNEPTSPYSVTASRRPFFAQAASTESLRTRYLSTSFFFLQNLA
jgi:DNA repair exonuclease SbcCD ATPase subunit